MKTLINKINLETIKISIINGQYKKAKDLIQFKCKSKPEKQARRLAQTVGALIECGMADNAVTLINQFNN